MTAPRTVAARIGAVLAAAAFATLLMLVLWGALWLWTQFIRWVGTCGGS